MSLFCLAAARSHARRPVCIRRSIVRIVSQSSPGAETKKTRLTTTPPPQPPPTTTKTTKTKTKTKTKTQQQSKKKKKHASIVFAHKKGEGGFSDGHFLFLTFHTRILSWVPTKCSLSYLMFDFSTLCLHLHLSGSHT